MSGGKMKGVTRRHFLWLLSMSAAGWAAGCAANPVTGRPQLMLVSEDQEIQMDQMYSPIQFSADYGPIQDHALNDYVKQVGRDVAAHTHRKNMPYSFRVVNATYVNAYAFPGGSIACTRGALLALESEAELAALLGHELGHINARHTAQQMSKGSSGPEPCRRYYGAGGHAGDDTRPTGFPMGKHWGRSPAGLLQPG